MESMREPRKGLDYTGIAVVFFCHDGQGNFLFHKRTDKCRDEHGRWDPGGGAVEFGESLADALARELEEEYGVAAEESEYLGFREVRNEQMGRPALWITFDFKVRVPRDKVIIGNPEKMELLEWFGNVNDVPQPLHSQLPECFRKYGDKLR